MSLNGVIEKGTGDLIRAGFCDFLNDGSFDSLKETFVTNVPKPPLVKKEEAMQFHRWNGTDWIVTTISDIVDIDFNWEKNYNDYKSARADLASKVALAGGFSNLSLEEKKIASKWFVVEKLDRDTVHSFDEQVENGIFFHSQSTKSREKRAAIAIAEIYNRLSKVERDTIEIEVNAGNLLDPYTSLGREGTISGDPVGLYDYIQGVVGTFYENIGLKDKPYTPIDMVDMQELANKVIDILNGNY